MLGVRHIFLEPMRDCRYSPGPFSWLSSPEWRQMLGLTNIVLGANLGSLNVDYFSSAL